MVVAQICTVPETFRFFGGFFRILASPDVRVVIAAGGNVKTLAALACEEGVEYHALRLSRDATLGGILGEALDIWWWLCDLRPDIVHAHTPKAVLLATIGAALLGIRCRVVHLHGFPADTARGAKRWALLGADVLAIACAHHVFAVSYSIERKARRLAFQSEDRRICVLGYGSASGIDTEVRFSPERFDETLRNVERERLGVSGRGVVVCFIGRFTNDKGVDVLATAWRQVRLTHPDARLVLVGEADARSPASEHAIAALRAFDDVVFTGVVPDVERILAAVDIVVLPTLREGLPYVPLEAGSMAVPVVTSNIPECAEVILDGVTGTLVPCGSAESLAAAIGKYIVDKPLRAMHGDAARRRVQSRYSSRFVRAEIAKWYKKQLCALRYMQAGKV